ncbi:MAG: hypothetical protein U0Z70_00915 [Thermomicrobiales bacterium]
MYPGKTSTARSTTTRRPQPQRLRAALDSLTLGLRELEEQLPLPAERLVRDSTPARQKATALRIDFEEISLRLTRMSRRLDAMHGIEE